MSYNPTYRGDIPAPWLEIEEHAGIAEGIRLYRLEIKEFGNTCVIGAQELLVNIWFDGCAVNFNKTMSTKELCLEGKAEDSFNANFASAIDDVLHKFVADTLLMQTFFYGNGTNFS